MKRWGMFGRLIMRAITYRKLPSVVAVLTVVLGVGIIGGLANVYADMSGKMSREFRAYGANMLAYPKNSAARLDAAAVEALVRNLENDKLVGIAPVQYSAAHVGDAPIVLAGTEFAQTKLVSPYWQVEGAWASDAETAAMVGAETAAKLDLRPGSEFIVTSADKGRESGSAKLTVKGIVTTGGQEDNQVFVPMQLANRLTGSNQVDIVLISLLAKGDALERQAQALSAAVPAASVKPIKQLAKSEAIVVEKIRKLILFISVVIVGTTVLTVEATLISMVVDRRKEISLKKAIGAQNRSLIGEFMAEGAVIGLAGATLGIGFAHFVAQLIGRVVFQAEIAFQAMLIPWAYLGAMLVIGAAFIVPVRRMVELEPAIMLKGE